MIKIDKLEVWGWEHTIRGMRNPMNSWDKSDSKWVKDVYNDTTPRYDLGPNDLKLMRNLYKASLDNNFAHRKFLRQIMISFDITAPLYWWKEFDTYKVGTTANSTSTMHKIHSKEFNIDDFSHEHMFGDFDPIPYKTDSDANCELLTSGPISITSGSCMMIMISLLNFYREKFLETKDKEYWWQMIQLLPSSYNQTRTVTMNYENAVSMIKQRTGHKLDEWRIFVKFLKDLPHLEEIITLEDEE